MLKNTALTLFNNLSKLIKFLIIEENGEIMIIQLGEKVKQNIIVILMVVIALRSLVNFNFAQCFVFIALCGIHSFNLYLKEKNKNNHEQKHKEELEEIKASISSLMLRNAVKPQQGKPDFKNFGF